MIDNLEIPWIVYDPASGRILRTGRSQTEERALAQADGGAIILGATADDVNEYVLDGEIVPRPTLAGFDKLTILADDEDVATITLPVGTQVQFDGQTYEIAEGDQDFEFAADVAGSYTIKIFPPWPYYDATYTIEATEP